MTTPKTVADFIRELQDHCGDPETTDLTLAAGGQPLAVASVTGYPGHVVMLFRLANASETS